MLTIKGGRMSEVDSYLEREKKDRNAWWKMDSGEMQNLFNIAVEERNEAQAQLAEASDENLQMEAQLAEARAQIEKMKCCENCAYVIYQDGRSECNNDDVGDCCCANGFAMWQLKGGKE